MILTLLLYFGSFKLKEDGRVCSVNLNARSFFCALVNENF
jgi:hypothetical protein